MNNLLLGKHVTDTLINSCADNIHNKYIKHISKLYIQQYSSDVVNDLTNYKRLDLFKSPLIDSVVSTEPVRSLSVGVEGSC